MKTEKTNNGTDRKIKTERKQLTEQTGEDEDRKQTDVETDLKRRKWKKAGVRKNPDP